MSYVIYELGDRGLTFEFSDQPSPERLAHLKKMKVWIEDHPFTGLQDIVLSYQSLTLLVDRFLLVHSGIKDITSYLKELFYLADAYAAKAVDSKPSRAVRIPVCYDAEFAFDIGVISAATKLSAKRIIDLHVEKEYTVYMIGFLPGFPYLGFVDDRISFSRKNSPIANVPAGSVGIAGKQTGIYPLDSPGGWQIIGRTPIQLFDPRRDPPVELQPGDRVQFYKISRSEFSSLSRKQR